MRVGRLRDLSDVQLLSEVQVQQRACEDSVVDMWIDQADRQRNMALAECQRRGGWENLRAKVAVEGPDRAEDVDAFRRLFGDNATLGKVRS